MFYYLLWVLFGLETTLAYHSNVPCGDNTHIDLKWTVNYTASRITLSIDVPNYFLHDGCEFGFGISGTTSSDNVDSIFMRITENEIQLMDTYVDEYGMVYTKQRSVYQIKSYSINDHATELIVGRPFEDCNKNSYSLDTGTTALHCFKYCHKKNKKASLRDSILEDIILIKRRNATILMMLETNNLPFKLPMKSVNDMSHSATLVQLLKPPIPEQPLPHKYFDILAPDVIIPDHETTYWCSTHKLPDELKNKTHAVGFGGVIDISNSDIVHHIEVFRCDNRDKIVPMYSGYCGKVQPPEVARCNRVLAAWAKGADIFMYPKEAGIPVASHGDSHYLRLQIHYHNPLKYKTKVDRSGMRFFYTDSLRQYDAGILEFGVTYNDLMVVPPRSNEFMWSGFCTKECTEKGLPESGIHIFGSQLHTHLAGRQVWTSHSRGTTRLRNINQDLHYSTWFQEIRHVYPTVHVLPGDSLTTSCVYNTKERQNVTMGGFGIFEEMCVNYVHYYPVTKLEVCKSTVSATSLLSFFVVDKIATGQPLNLNYLDISENYHNISWDLKQTEKLQDLYKTAAVDEKCLIHGLPSAKWQLDDLQPDKKEY